jgi:MFS family permease
MIFWSLACASHAIAANFAMLAASRFLLGMGEGGGFPAASRAVAENFAVQHRATAMGIINAGTAVGGIVAPPLIALIISYTNWRWVFVLTARRDWRGRCGGCARILGARAKKHPDSLRATNLPPAILSARTVRRQKPAGSIC